MRRRIIGGVVVGVAALSAVGTATARVPSHPTTIIRDGASPIGTTGDALIFGHLESPKHRCVSDRRMSFVANYSDGSTIPLDTDRSSTNGFWNMRGAPDGASSITATVARKRIGSRHHRQICKGSSLVISNS